MADEDGVIPAGEPFDLAGRVVGLERDSGRARPLDGSKGPVRLDGFTFGAPVMAESAPHNGEMHPDADELLYLVAGRVRVWFEYDDGDRTVEVQPGQAIVVPRGVWHKVLVDEPSHLVHLTPGPGSAHRPLPEAAPTGTSTDGHQPG
jgi:mannose-6-phosphate isomerase-like protein (cupin superfamily)